MTSTPLIIGHRGASAVAPENTLAAFSRAIRDGSDGIEFDVRLSRDRVPIVIHDATLKRTGLIDRPIAKLTSQELEAVDVGSWFEGGELRLRKYAGEKLPTLRQVFDLFISLPGLLYVEMKCGGEGAETLAAAVVDLIQEFRFTDRVVVESFDLSAIAKIKKIHAGIRTAALFEPKLSSPLSTVRRVKMVDLARQCCADEIALHHTLAAPRVIEKASAQGLEIVVWTVDDVEWIARARSLGIKALLANDPGMMVRHRDAKT